MTWESGRRKPSAVVCVSLAALVLAAFSAATAEEPRNPGAVTACPPWLRSGAPFDVEALFAEPAPGRNAAPLYFEAFGEFGADADESLKAAGKPLVPAARDREKRIQEFNDVLNKTPQTLVAAAADKLLGELNDGFRKLAAAQRRPECVFASGLGTDALLPHLQISRTVARALYLRVARDVARGNLDRPIQDVAAILRLSRDVRPRGHGIAQLVSAALDSVATQQAAPLILRAPGLKLEQCDRLIAVLSEHDERGLDRFTAGIKTEYVMQRTFLHALGDKRRTVAGPDGRPVEEKLTDAQAAALLREVANAMGGPTKVPPFSNTPSQEGLETMIRGHASSWGRERKAVDEIAAALIVPGLGYSDRVHRIEDLVVKHPSGRTPDSLWASQGIMPDHKLSALVSARADAYIRSSLILASLTRWRLKHGAEPTPAELAAACKEAGLAAIPSDPFAGGPMKMTILDGHPVVYSIGPDGVDDRALVDSDLARQPRGDLIFRLKEVAR